ncbi:MAG: prepilin-type N-terminal cleavage/methylation domain-containing protein [Candidatus Omnitrophica bacterium]|nr:prepilin-type N-terminal cleavage/methylation domain-containing protein [Candidatus Omnitrophota bacterium]
MLCAKYYSSRFDAKTRGFTLIELIIVAAIIVVLVAMSSPLFMATFRDLEVKNSLYDLGKIIKYAQERAIIEEKRYRLILSFDRNLYFLLSEDANADKDEESGDSSGGGEDAGWEKVPGKYGKVYHLPEGAEFQGEVDSLNFYPSGRCDSVTIQVKESDNESYEIKTNGRAGYVSISKTQGEDEQPLQGP